MTQDTNVKTVSIYFKRKKYKVPKFESTRDYSPTVDNRPHEGVVNGVIDDD